MSILSNRHCLITGASRGLGARIASSFWDEGASLMLVARSASALAKVASSLSPHLGQHVHVLSADLADPTVPDLIVHEVLQRFGSIQVLVNNAAIQGPVGAVWENDWREWQTTLQVNLLAPVALCRLCAPIMAQTGYGKIINLSGGGGASSRPNFSAYATAKAGLIRFSETLAAEVHHMGISVNCVAPGAMDTEMLEAVVRAGPVAAGHKEYDQALKIRHSGGSDQGRAANLCVFLASTHSDGITGKLLSAVWDPWETLPEHRDDLRQTDVYTLRRIVPKDRGMGWGES